MINNNKEVYKMSDIKSELTFINYHINQIDFENKS